MHFGDTEWVDLEAYELKNISRTLFDEWKAGRYQDAALASWACVEQAFLKRFFTL